MGLGLEMRLSFSDWRFCFLDFGSFSGESLLLADCADAGALSIISYSERLRCDGVRGAFSSSSSSSGFFLVGVAVFILGLSHIFAWGRPAVGFPVLIVAELLSRRFLGARACYLVRYSAAPTMRLGPSVVVH